METALASPIGHNLPPSDAELLQKQLAAKHAKVLEGAAKLVAASERIPETIEDDATAGKAGDYIKLVTGCIKNLEAERVNEKEPFLSQGRVVDGFFKGNITPLEQAKLRAGKPLDAWLKAKAMAEQRRRNEEAAALQAKAIEEAKAAKMLLDAQLQESAQDWSDKAAVTGQAADKAVEAAQAKPAEMAQSRGTSGSLASLRTRWVGAIDDIGLLDLEKLRPYLHVDALQKAINMFVGAGGRELKGAHIFEKSETVVR